MERILFAVIIVSLSASTIWAVEPTSRIVEENGVRYREWTRIERVPVAQTRWVAVEQPPFSIDQTYPGHVAWKQTPMSWKTSPQPYSPNQAGAAARWGQTKVPPPDLRLPLSPNTSTANSFESPLGAVRIVHIPQRTLGFEERSVVERVALGRSDSGMPAPTARVVDRRDGRHGQIGDHNWRSVRGSSRY